MKKSHHTPRNLMISLAVLAASVAIGCGGGDSSEPTPPAPASGVGVGAGGASAVVPEGTAGRLGPADRVQGGKTPEILGQGGKISPDSNKPTPAQKNGVAGAADCQNTDEAPTAENLAASSEATRCLINAERASAGLAALGTNAQLATAAQGMADEMVEKQFFSHDTPDGRNVADRVVPTGYLPRNDDWVLGENLAWGSGALSTPRAIVNGWMNSTGHRKNILDSSYKDVGLGVKLGSPSPSVKGGTVFVHNFGARGSGGSSAAGSGDATVDVGGSNATAAQKAKAKAKAKAKKKKRKKRRR
jgi:uncharacterized protein YkwD